MPAFDTLQAEVLVKAFARTPTEDLATKQDLLSEGLTIRAKITDLKAKIIKWIAGALIVDFFGVAGLVVTLIKSIGH